MREAFARNFAECGEAGASVAIDGERAVDLCAGDADSAGRNPWRRDTVVTTYSTTKGMTALCAHPLIDRGELDLDATVAGYWPQFAAAGKQAVTIRQLLNHTAGLPAIREPPAAEAIFDWERMTSPLAAQQPWAELGTKMGYHSPAPQRGSGSATCRTRGCSVRAMSVRAASSRRSTRRSEPSLDALLVAE